MWLALILLTVFMVAGAVQASRWFKQAGGLRSFRAGSPSRSHGLLEATVEDHNSRHKIALIDIRGLISGELIDGFGHNLVELVKDQLALAEEDAAVKAVVLRVDSPGGEVLASDSIYRAIAEFQKKSKKPVVASMGGLAASGGYYVSAPCRWIVANELTITGSIGVIMHGFNYRGLLDKVGVRPMVYKSGRFKDMLSGSKAEGDILPEERAMAQDLIDQTFSRFKQVVQEGREEARRLNTTEGKRLASDWESYADGRILLGKEAWRHGFVDELGDFKTALDRALRLANLTQANLIRYEQPFELGSLLRWFVKSEPPGVRVDLGLDLPRLEAGRLYFLSPALFH